MTWEELIKLPKGTPIFYFDDELQVVVEEKFEKVEGLRIHFLRGHTGYRSAIKIQSFDEVSLTLRDAWGYIQRETEYELGEARDLVKETEDRLVLIKTMILNLN